MTDESSSREETIDILLEIADAYSVDASSQKRSDKKDIRPELARLIESPTFKEYHLEEKDILIIAILFGDYLDSEDGMETRSLLKKIEREKKYVLREIHRINRLRESGILEIGRGQRYGADRDIEDSMEEDDDSASSFTALSSTVRISNLLLRKLLDKGETLNLNRHDDVEPYKDNLEYLADQFMRLTLLKDDYYDDDFLINPDRLRRFRRDTTRSNSNQYEYKLKMFEDSIAARLSKTAQLFPLEALKKKKKLQRKEELVIIALLRKEDEYFLEDLLNTISKTPYERLTNKRLIEEDGRLAREKIIEVDTRHRRSGTTTIIRINTKLRDKLFEEKKRLKNEIAREDLFEVVKPSVSINKVILHPKTLEDVNLAIDMIHGKALDILIKWGIKGGSLIHSVSGKKKSQSATMLFYGPPGTGKTLTAHAVAHSLKKVLLTLDCSRVLSCWVGESEQNTRRIFDRYRDISEGIKNPTILLMNEADQFLHRRISASRSADHMYNQMQNIFLEQLEQFNGILIATTNLVGNMDTAFSRRFHYKIEFKRPGADERFKLWQVHIPEKTALADNVDMKYLAKQYDLTGGEIALIVRNAATRAARKSDRIHQEDFIQACEDELAGSFGEERAVRSGF